MAITLTTVGGMPNSSRQVGFLIGSEADIVNLPTTTTKGNYNTTVDELSTAVTNDGRIFVLGNDGKWHEW
jgi:hypothetical protein